MIMYAYRIEEVAMQAAEVIEAIKHGRENFSGMHIVGDLILSGAVFSGLHFNDAYIDGDIEIKGSTATFLRLSSARVKGWVSIADAAIARIVLYKASVEGGVAVYRTKAERMDFEETTIGRNLTLVRCTIVEELNLEGTVITNNLLLPHTTAGIIYPGDNLGLALQCGMHFGKNVELSTALSRRLAEAWLGAHSKKENEGG